MKPNPLSSLNHFTVPVGMWVLLHGMFVLRRGGCCLELRPASACTAFAGLLCRPDAHDRSRSPRARVVEMFLLHTCPIGHSGDLSTPTAAISGGLGAVKVAL